MNAYRHRSEIAKALSYSLSSNLRSSAAQFVAQFQNKLGRAVYPRWLEYWSPRYLVRETLFQPAGVNRPSQLVLGQGELGIDPI